MYKALGGRLSASRSWKWHAAFSDWNSSPDLRNNAGRERGERRAEGGERRGRERKEIPLKYTKTLRNN